MTRKLKILILPALLLFMFSFNGCILDSFDSIPLDIPITFEINISGQNAQNQASTDFCLSDNQLYLDYQSKINQINLLEITFRPTEVVPTNLSGDITITIAKSDGTVLITKPLGTISPADYLPPNSPYVLTLTQAELQVIDAYLNASGDCFTATISVTNMNPGAGVDKTLNASIDVVFRTDTSL
jgi:hypothetical protein